jgi:hypothetical protein
MNPPTLQLTRCPECEAPAEIEHRSVLESTAGPLEHVKIRCINRHWFHLPVDHLDSSPSVVAPRAAARNRR